MRGKGKRSYAGSIRRKERKKSAVELQAEGLSERRIGEVLGISKSEAHRLLAEAEAEAVPDAALVEARRNRIRAVVDGQLESWVPRSLKGDPAAALAVTRFLDRLAKLDGVDAPTRTELSGPNGGPLSVDVDAGALLLTKLASLVSGDAAGGAASPDHPKPDG